LLFFFAQTNIYFDSETLSAI